MTDHRPTITATEAQAIADGLGPWAVLPNENPTNAREAVLYYVGPEPELEGAQLHLGVAGLRLACSGSMHVRVPGYRDTFSNQLFLGQYLSHNERNALPHRISVSLEKPTTQIVRDIARRLVPGYLASFAKARRSFAAAQAKQVTQQALAEELARTIPGATCKHGANVGDESLVRCYGDLPDLRVMAHGSVCTHGYFSMSSAQARLFAAFLASPAWQQAKGA